MTSTGCGDDAPAQPDARVDAAMFDAPPMPDAMPDAMVAGLLRSNTIAVTELEVTGPIANAAPPNGPGGLRGAAVPVTFRDLSTITNPPTVVGASPVNGCQVTVWDLQGGDTPPTEVDEGVVSVTGTGSGAFGCAFNTTFGQYLCQSGDSAASGVVPTGATATPNANGTVSYDITGANFDNAAYRGMWIVISGFPNAAANGRLPIAAAGTAAGGPSMVVVPNLNMLAAPSVVATAGTYLTIVGAGPMPSGGGAGFDTFLDDGTGDVVVTKPTTDDVPEFTVTVKANGEGLTLDDTSVQPHALGATGVQTFSCGGTNGDCGPSAGGSVINGFIIFGETSDGSLADGCNGGACSPFEMPAPVNTYATFQCSAVGLLGNATPQTVSITAEAMTAIMGTTPTRIQTTIANAAGEIAVASDQTSSTFVVVGHGLLGWTDVAAP